MEPAQTKYAEAEPRASAAPARFGITLLVLLVLFPVALTLDIPLSTWAHDSGLVAFMKGPKHYYLIHYGVRFYGVGWFTLVLATGLVIRDSLRKTPAANFAKDAALVALSAIFTVANVPMKWIIGRVRPNNNISPFQLHPFSKLIRFNSVLPLSFPSGDVSLAFAMTGSLTMIAPRWWPLWYILGFCDALERIAEGAHYPSDTVGGAALGICCALVARKLVDRLYSSRKELPANGN